MEEFWNNRYKEKEYAYGEKPNAFFKETIEKLKLNGKLQLPAEGEGRNAVYASKKGIDVVAFDISSEGKIKAQELAEKQNVTIDYRVGEFEKHNFELNSFDALGLIFAHFPKNKTILHEQMAELIKPNGYIFLEGFSANNISYRERNPKIGGPTNLEMLYTVEEMKTTFKNFEVILLEEKEIKLNEGSFHNGIASVIRYIGKKTT
ncbi:class I SAM-dependent methyltransferase [Cellulophaga baltica]|uniref:class I SAM-dependent methyltransferase n=1 Tax=Cellulophaga baltica TaxID=76594 RepID=UPI00041116DE|nr:class I SAM-dependent methyltransferase [Cellulophaga baltica]AIY14117.1 methyltransferase [Cellulophaga baltica NN016038]